MKGPPCGNGLNRCEVLENQGMTVLMWRQAWVVSIFWKALTASIPFLDENWQLRAGLSEGGQSGVPQVHELPARHTRATFLLLWMTWHYFSTSQRGPLAGF